MHTKNNNNNNVGTVSSLQSEKPVNKASTSEQRHKILPSPQARNGLCGPPSQGETKISRREVSALTTIPHVLCTWYSLNGDILT